MISLRSRKALWLLSPLALSLFLSQTALAQPATQVVDLNTTREQESFVHYLGGPFASLGNALFFVAEDGIHGLELWKTDGTAAGTALVRDLCPGACSSQSWLLGELGGRILFLADDAEHGKELWSTDGTSAGTVLVRDIRPGTVRSVITQYALKLDGALLFAADDGVHGNELWKTDGTEAGTALVADLNPGAAGSDPQPSSVLGGVALLSADDGTHGREPWTTDGTAGGTQPLADLRPGSEGSITPWQTPDLFRSWLTTSAGRVLFVADDGVHGQELWASDGTPEGTILVRDIYPGTWGGSPFGLTDMAGTVYFTVNDGTLGYELWRTDGTPAGTSLVKDIHAGFSSSSPRELTVVGGQLFFRALESASGYELWKSDGTAAGTTLVRDIWPGTASSMLFSYFALTDLGGTLLFFADDGTGLEVWTSDGTEAGTLAASEMSGQAVSTVPFIPWYLRVGSRLYFRSFNLAGGIDLWSTDGTAAGTGLVADVLDQASGVGVSFWDGSVWEPSAWGALGDKLVFMGDDGTTGNEPWVTDGTAAGTQQLAEILPGIDWSFFRELTPLGDSQALFSTDALWKTDGTPAGTAPLFATGGPAEVWGLARLGSTVFFSGGSTAAGQELWKTDGTADGTALVKDILPGTAGSGPFRLIAVGSTLFFAANGGPGDSNQELWKSDGTAEGTVLVKDIRPGMETSEIDHPTPLGSRLFFTADDGTSGREPWVSDGTAAGTVRLQDIAPGAEPSFLPSFAIPGERITAVLGSTVFFQAGAGADKELWASDGTEAGTRRVKDIRPGTRGSEPRWLTVAGGRLFFSADDGTHGRELWVSDGTEAGTVLVGDLLPGAGSSLPRELVAAGNAVVFSATDGVTGVEPWASDGTWVRRLGDLAPGALPSSPVRFTPVGDQVYFAANDATTGFELWSLPQSALAGPLDFYTLTPCRLADTRATIPLLTNQPRTLQVTGSCGIPAEAQAVTVNFTVVTPNGSGYLIAWPTGTDKPGTASLTYSPAVTRTNNGVVELGTGGQIDVQGQTAGENGQVHLVVDVVGYFR